MIILIERVESEQKQLKLVQVLLISILVGRTREGFNFARTLVRYNFKTNRGGRCWPSVDPSRRRVETQRWRME